MRLNKGVEDSVGGALKSTTNEDSESSEEVDEDKEMKIFAKRFNRFMKSDKVQKIE
ncbi:hypothetical protein PVK06_030547 [Gossypium arboreum]|uniref:Uncharacterized protein n=1 Tax=Gossypium arboreum TaxID=29729 RepID=A0ABR0NNJ8_GOSAR|nr:hypothetical protein PVK06_030547 [Gossypium arboreum]